VSQPRIGWLNTSHLPLADSTSAPPNPLLEGRELNSGYDHAPERSLGLTTRSLKRRQIVLSRERTRE
jgi:hypothetical protein